MAKLEKVTEKATQIQEETSRLPKIEFQRITWKAEENNKNLQADTSREIKYI